MNKEFFFLPNGYKHRVNTTVEGVAKSGEISDKGIVTHVEHWDGRKKARVGQASIRLVINPDGTLRNMTRKEKLDRGYTIAGKGPIGIQFK